MTKKKKEKKMEVLNMKEKSIDKLVKITLGVSILSLILNVINIFIK